MERCDLSTASLGLARAVRIPIAMEIEILRDCVVKKASDKHEDQNLSSELMSHVIVQSNAMGVG